MREAAKRGRASREGEPGANELSKGHRGEGEEEEAVVRKS